MKAVSPKINKVKRSSLEIPHLSLSPQVAWTAFASALTTEDWNSRRGGAIPLTSTVSPVFITLLFNQMRALVQWHIWALDIQRRLRCTYLYYVTLSGGLRMFPPGIKVTDRTYGATQGQAIASFSSQEPLRHALTRVKCKRSCQEKRVRPIWHIAFLLNSVAICNGIAEKAVSCKAFIG